jgi:hypothetical protein
MPCGQIYDIWKSLSLRCRITSGSNGGARNAVLRAGRCGFVLLGGVEIDEEVGEASAALVEWGADAGDGRGGAPCNAGDGRGGAPCACFCWISAGERPSGKDGSLQYIFFSEGSLEW